MISQREWPVGINTNYLYIFFIKNIFLNEKERKKYRNMVT